MVKHELLAPFSGQQFYPMAFQVKLDSAGTTVPAPTGKFPDMYRRVKDRTMMDRTRQLTFRLNVSDFVELGTDGPSFKYPGIAVYQNGIVCVRDQSRLLSKILTFCFVIFSKGDSGGAATAPGEESAPVAPVPAPSTASAIESVTSNVASEPTTTAAEPITTDVEAPIAITATATSGIVAPSDLPSVSEIEPVATGISESSAVKVPVPATSVSVVAPAPTVSEIVPPVETIPTATMPDVTETDALPVESAMIVDPEVL